MPDRSEVMRKRVLFRSHHTGMKENDLLLGGFADQHLATMSDADVAWFESLMMDNNDIDLYNWILGKTAVPERINHPVMKMIIDYKNSL